MKISDFETLKKYSDASLFFDTINIKEFWESLYNQDFIKKERIDGKYVVIKISRRNDFSENPIKIEEFVFSIDQKELQFRISSETNKIPTKGLNRFFHKDELNDINTINNEIEKLVLAKEDIWSRLMLSGSLPIY